MAAFPLIVDGKAIGSFTVYSSEAGFFDEGEVSLLDELAGDLSFALLSMGQEEKRSSLETTIKRGKEEWEKTFDAITDPIMLLDTGHTITRVNRAMADKLGVSPKEAVGLTCHKAVHGLDQPHPECPHSLLLADGRTHSVEIFEERIGGYFMVADSPLFDAEGRLCGSVHYARDITARKMAEEKLSQANTLVENSATMLFRWRAEEGWPVEYVSNNVAQLGYTPEELLSGQVAYASIVHPDDLARVAGEVSKFTASGAERFTQEYRVITKGGGVRWLEDRTAVERDAAGAATHYQGIVTDITDRKLAEEGLKKEKAFSDSAIDSLPGIFYLFDDQKKFIRWNKNLETVAGYSADALSRMQPIDFFPDEDKERVGRKIEEAMKSGKAVTEAEIVSADGTRTLYMLTASRFPLDGKDCFLGTGVDISERRRAEDAVRESEAKFRHMIESSIVGVYIIQDGRFVYVNARFAEIFGYSQEDIVHDMKVEDLIAPASSQAVLEHIRQRVSGEPAADRTQFRGIKADGSEIDIENFCAMTEYEGKAAVIGTLVDITARKLAEDALTDSERRLRVILDSAFDGILVADAQTRGFTLGNRAIREMLGYSEEELIGLTVEDIHPAESLPEVMRRFELQLKGELKVATDTPVKPKNGPVFFADISASPTEVAGRDSIVGVFRDVTERRKAEAALCEKDLLLSESQHLAHIGSWAIDVPTGRITWTEETYRIYGVTPDIFNPYLDSLYELIHEDDRQAMREWASACLAGEKPGELDFRTVCPSGEIRVLSGRGDMQYDTDGRPVRMVGTVQDVTEKRKAEAALKDEAAVTGALLEAARAAGGNLDWDDVAGSMARLLLRFTGGNGVFIFTLARDGMLIPRKAAGLPDADLAPFYSLRVMAGDIGMFRLALSAKKTLRFDSDSLPMYMDAAYAGPLRLKEAAVTPIPVRDGVAGFILTNYDSLPEDPRTAEIIEGIARQLGVAHDNSRLYAETRNKGIELARSVETLKVLSEIDKRILSTLDRDEILKGAVSQIRRVAPADIVGVLLADEDEGVLRFAYGWSLGMNIGDTVPFGHCSGYRTLKTGRTLARVDLAEEADLSAMDRGLMDGGIKSDIFVPIVCKEKGFGLLHVGSYRVAGFSTEDVETIENLARQMGIALENTRLISDVEEMFIGVVTAMASAIDAKSPWTKGHSERVTNYAMMTAARMGLGQKEMDALRLGGLLHDTGKIGTYDQILDKPGKLTDEEFSLIKRHPDAGANILGPIKQFKDMIPIIRHHHERWDGRGYPAGLAGEDIPLLARILCVADSFDSMTADRPYRKSLGVEFAVEEIKRCAGSQFDPEVAKAFVGMLEETR